MPFCVGPLEAIQNVDLPLDLFGLEIHATMTPSPDKTNIWPSSMVGVDRAPGAEVAVVSLP